MMLILSCSSGKNWIKKKIEDDHLLMTNRIAGLDSILRQKAIDLR